MRHLTGFFALVTTIAAGLVAIAFLGGNSPRNLYSGRPTQYTGSEVAEVERLVGYHLPGPPSTAPGWHVRDIYVIPTYLEPPSASAIAGRPPALAASASYFGGPLCADGIPRCVSIQYASDTGQTIVLNVYMRPQTFPRHFPSVPNAPGVHPIHEQYEPIDINGARGTLATHVLTGDDNKPLFTTVFVQWRLGPIPLTAVAPIRTENATATRDLMTRQDLLALLATIH